MLHCFERKDEQQLPSNLTTGSAITDKDRDDLEEIKKIRHMLNPIEEVFVVARQSRLKPGDSKFTPNVVFATDRVEYTSTRTLQQGIQPKRDITGATSWISYSK
jgi:hypothetical protein